MIRDSNLYLVKLISTLLPKYTFGDPTNTTLGAYIPIYKHIPNKDVPLSDQWVPLNNDYVYYIGYFVLKSVGIRNFKDFTLFGVPIGHNHLKKTLKDWESIGIKHSFYQKIYNSEHDTDGYVYYKLWLDDEK